MNWNDLAASLIGAALGSGIVGVGFQLYLSHALSKRLEQFKTTLSGELFERQTKFAWLHTERSKVLVNLYALLADVDAAFTMMLQPIQTGDAESRTAKITQASAAIVKFFSFCSQNAVFFDDELQHSLFQLDEKYRRVWSTYVPNHELLPTGTEWADAWNELGQEVTPIQTEVQDKVRTMLGVDFHE